ncbi:MAG: dihydrofolate reductase [Devosia sp.]
MSIEIAGHAIVSADGRIADRYRQMPTALRNEKDWTRFQAALDRAVLVVLGRLGHEAHANPGRRRLVVTSRVERLEPIDEQVTLWNPAGIDFRDAAAELGITEGSVAVTGGQQVFDYFLRRFTRFDLVTVDGVLIPDGVPCFSDGWPEEVLAQAGLRVMEREALDPGARLEVWRR